MPKPDWPSPESLRSAAWMLDCEPRAIDAVSRVEAGTSGAFLDSGEPVVLFERHIFHRLTGGRFDAKYPELSFPTPGGYGKVSEQHGRLEHAADLCVAAGLGRDLALKSASWGLYQCMGYNHAAAGFQTLQGFINAMYRSVDDHLRAFVCFIRSNERMHEALRAKDWEAFKRLYNGPARNGYAAMIAAAYDGSKV